MTAPTDKRDVVAEAEAFVTLSVEARHYYDLEDLAQRLIAEVKRLREESARYGEAASWLRDDHHKLTTQLAERDKTIESLRDELMSKRFHDAQTRLVVAEEQIAFSDGTMKMPGRISEEGK